MHCPTNLAYEDGISNTIRHKLMSGRPDVPVWMMHDNLIRLVVTTYWVKRAHNYLGAKERLKTARTQHELVTIAQSTLESTIPSMLNTMKRLSHEYVITTDPDRRKSLSRNIANYDAIIRVIKRGAGLLIRLIYLYRQGYNSVDSARELGFSPQFCRQQIHRLNVTLRNLVLSPENGLDVTLLETLPKPRTRRCHVRVAPEIKHKHLCENLEKARVALTQNPEILRKNIEKGRAVLACKRAATAQAMTA